MPGLLGRGAIRSVDALNGSAHGTPLAFASELEPGEYQKVLFALGLHGDLKRWYRDQSYSIEIRLAASSRTESLSIGPCEVAALRSMQRAGCRLFPEHEPLAGSRSHNLQESARDRQGVPRTEKRS